MKPHEVFFVANGATGQDAVKTAKEFDSELSIKSDQGDAILSSILDLISLGLHQGAVITVCAEGSDEVAAAEKIVECVEAIYDYPDK